jgi:beta-lactamase superfamily II metal-dependent hydrolase
MMELDDMTSAGYTGLEIDMLFVGDADAILITGHREDAEPTTILIDGGDAGDVTTVREFLRNRGIEHVDHLVNTHPHDDHAGGLEKLVQDRTLGIGRAWVHRPEVHIADTDLWVKSFSEAALQTGPTLRAAAVREADIAVKSVDTVFNLERLLAARAIPIREPFAGQEIGFLTVCGPSREYYEQLLQSFPASIRGVPVREAREALETLTKGIKAAVDKPLLDNPDCGPINNSSVILATRFNRRIVLLTADAGKQALERAGGDYALANVAWMQIPHHGSRYNITATLMEHFQPARAFISAAGTSEHPFACVIDGFKERGTKVYSTHHPYDGHLARRFGAVPARSGYVAVTPL